MADDLLDTLAEIAGAGQVLADAALRAGYERDWTGRWSGDALAVVRPADTGEVAAVVRACAERGAAIVTQGGNIGLVGGSVPRPAGGSDGRPQIVLSTARLDTIGPVDTATAQLPAGALMERAGIELTCAHLGIDPGFAPAPVCVLLECAAPSGDPLDELAEALDRAGVGDRAVSPADAAGRDRLMEIRDSHADAINAQGVPVKLDVGVPLDALAGFWERVGPAVRACAPDPRTVSFGHLADGNLHINVLGVAPEQVDALEDAVLGPVAGCGGTVSAEHGIGVHKVRHLSLTRAAGELRAMRALKRAPDPEGILNPSVALPADG